MTQALHWFHGAEWANLPFYSLGWEVGGNEPSPMAAQTFL